MVKDVRSVKQVIEGGSGWVDPKSLSQLTESIVAPEHVILEGAGTPVPSTGHGQELLKVLGAHVESAEGLPSSV